VCAPPSWASRLPHALSVATTLTRPSLARNRAGDPTLHPAGAASAAIASANAVTRAALIPPRLAH
jgi:hypothetical protein